VPARQRLVRPTATSERADRRVQEACRAVGDFIAYWGFKKIHGRVWATLATRKEPLSQAAIARLLGVSRALVSATIDDLSSHGLVRSTGPERHAPYVAVFDVWPTIADVLRSREWLLVERARVAFAAALTEVEALERQGRRTPYDRVRLGALLSMTQVARAFLRILIGLRRAPAQKSLGGWAGKAGGLLTLIKNAW
jgi:DNA-binding transcriptional regulator GbsR (MarR family)